jgi:hypothetical protein
LRVTARQGSGSRTHTSSRLYDTCQHGVWWVEGGG